MTLTPEAQAQIDADRHAAQARWDGAAPLVQPDHSPLAVGQTCWERRRDDAQHDTRGGVIARIIDNPDTGQSTIVVVNPYRNPKRGQAWDPRRDFLDADHLNPDDRKTLTAGELANMARRIFSCIGMEGTKRGWFSHHDDELLSIAVTFLKMSKTV